MSALIKSITSETYSNGPQGEQARTKSRAASAEVELLFAKDDLVAMQPDAPCIAKK